jgi:hypothetical protein
MTLEFYIHEAAAPLGDDRVEAACKALPGVSKWTWNKAERVISVDFDAGRVTPETLLFILTRSGLPASPNV